MGIFKTLFEIAGGLMVIMLLPYIFYIGAYVAAYLIMLHIAYVLMMAGFNFLKSTLKYIF